MELLDGWTTDTNDRNDCNITIEEKNNMFIAEKTVSVKDFQPKEVRSSIDKLKLKIMREEIKPDEGTIRDIEWLINYVEFGIFVQNLLPDWHRCDKCHLVRLCIHNVRDLSCICFECRYKDRVMDDVSNCTNMDSEPVRDFLQTGNLDPSVHWKTYAKLVKEELDEFHRRRERLQRAWNSPYIPLKRKK